MRDKLTQIKAVLGYGGSEVFPKQTELKSQALGMAGAGMGSITYGVAVIFCPLYIILSNSIKDSVNKKL